MVLFTALAGLAGTFIKDLITGKPAGSTLKGIGSSAIKAVKSAGSGIVKAVSPVFRASSPLDFIKKVGEAGLGVAGEIGKGIQTGEKLLDVLDVAAPLLGKTGESASGAIGEGIKFASGAQERLTRLSSGATQVGDILAGI
jgi:hypothetical protein